MAHPLHKIFPKNLSSALRDAKVDSEVAKQMFIVCPKEACSSLYKMDDPLTRVCTAKIFNKICGTSLGHTINQAHGRQKWKPFKTFQFIPPSASLKKLFASKQFNTLLEHQRTSGHDVLEDIQDGQVWKEFEDSGFFGSKFNLALMMNVDWYSPFKRSEYKVAAIMLTVLNLPRHERFKKKWTILAGTDIIFRYNASQHIHVHIIFLQV